MPYKRIIDLSDGGETRYYQDPEEGDAYVAVRAPPDLNETGTVVLRSASSEITASPYAVEPADRTVLADDSAGAITVELPAAIENENRELVVKKVGPSGGQRRVTVTGSGDETIDGEAEQVIIFQHDCMQLHCDGEEWFII